MPDDVDQNDILFKHEPIDETPNYPSHQNLYQHLQIFCCQKRKTRKV